MPRRTKPWIREPIWYLRSLALNAYYQTGWWKDRRQRFIQDRADNGLELRCDLCQDFWPRLLQQPLAERLVGEIPKWHVHHLTYDNVGDEPDEDLAYLCAACHHFVHLPDRQQSTSWRNTLTPIIGDIAERAADMRPEWEATFTIS